jgi:hypothetical protein
MRKKSIIDARQNIGDLLAVCSMGHRCDVNKIYRHIF